MIIKCKCGEYHFNPAGGSQTIIPYTIISIIQKCIFCGTEYKATYELAGYKEIPTNEKGGK